MHPLLIPLLSRNIKMKGGLIRVLVEYRSQTCGLLPFLQGYFWQHSKPIAVAQSGDEMYVETATHHGGDDYAAVC